MCIRNRGHSIECRIYAEDPYTIGMPSTGKLGYQHWPAGPGRRFDVAFAAGDSVSPYYDSMIAKVIVWDETRTRALQKMQRVLEDCVIFGVKTNIPLLQKILMHPEFVNGSYNTQFMAKNFPEGLPVEELSELETAFAQKAWREVSGGKVAIGNSSPSISSPFLEHWRQA